MRAGDGGWPTGARPAVQVEGSVVIRAEPSEVWSVLSDVSRWSRWHRGISFAQLRGPLERGTYFHWRVDGMNVLAVVSQVEEERELTWGGSCFGARLHHSWQLRSRGSGETELRAVHSVDGLFVRLLKGTVRRTVNRSMEEWFRGLKAGAEEGDMSERGEP